MEARVTRDSFPSTTTAGATCMASTTWPSDASVADDASGSAVIQFLTHITISRHTSTRPADSVILHIGPTASSIL